MPDVSFCRQPELAVVRVSGRDARKFLHAQTTQQVDDLGTGETRLAAWLNANGRVLALFDLLPDGESFLLTLPAGNVGAVVAGLKRFVLRDAVRIEPEADLSVLTVVGHLDDWLTAHDLALSPHRVVAARDAILARTGERRIDVIATAAALPAILGDVAEIDSDAAALVAIGEGRPDVPASLADRYTPHMLALERDAVSFTKGCYPGQEIVARTEHRGEVKRRLRRFACGAGSRPAAGDAVVDSTGAAAGEVNRSAPTRHGFELLAVVGVEPRSDGLRLADGRALVSPST